METRFDEIFTDPENQVFKVVFYPDRVYHAQYLNATRSSRYRYNVHEVRSIADITAMKGQVYLDGQRLCNFLRLEYRGSRLVELVRERGRFLRSQLRAWVHLIPDDPRAEADAIVKLEYCPWIDAYQVEIWETLEAPGNTRHDVKVLDMMGRNGSITRVPSFGPAVRDTRSLRRIEVAFQENDRNLPAGFLIGNPQWDNNYQRTHQEPRTSEPSSDQNTVTDENYLLNFQRGWFIRPEDTQPVRYRNALMNDGDPERHPDNIVEMKWILQREFGGTLVFFHEVTVPPGKVEGAHRHVGSEELYYIVEGRGIGYLAAGDDPKLDNDPQIETVRRSIFGLDPVDCKQVPLEPGCVIFTKSGGVHGIRNNGTEPLKFVAFLYHSS